MAQLSLKQKPLSVIIVDDEYMIVKGLERLIHWQELGLVLVGTAGNGQEALDLMHQQAVDIVITDVNMPSVTGIEFVKAAKELGQHFEFIFISGYQEFDYVKQGMALGAKNYLLKPINKQELHQVLGQVATNIRQQRELAVRLSQHDADQLGHWLRTGQGPLPVQFQAVDQPDWQLVLVPDSPHEGQLAGVSIMTLGPWQLQLCPKGMEVEQTSPLYHRVGQSLTQIQATIQQLLHAEARRHFYGRDWEAEGLICLLSQEEGVPGKMDATRAHLVEDLMSHLYEAIDHQNHIKLDADLDSLLTFCLEHELAPQEVYHLATLIRHYFNLKTHQIASANLLEEIVDQHMTFQELSQRLKKSLDLGGAEKRHQLYPPIVNEVLAAIYERYNENISMKSLADDLHVNVMYLGQLFKREVGMTLSRYINQYRLAMAKDLLIASKLSIAQIAVKVGYQNQAYFYRVFKQAEGLSPKEYRQHYHNYLKMQDRTSLASLRK